MDNTTTVNRGRSALLAAAVLLACAAPLAGQIRTQQVTGTVRDFASGQPLAGVTVRVQDSRQEVRTGGDGRFVLAGVPAGVWTLEVEAPGYGGRTYAMDLEPGGFAEVEITLDGAVGEPQAPRPAGVPSGAATEEHREDGLGHVVDADAIARVASSVPNLGELVRQAIPALRAREAAGFAGVGLCLEFRSVGPSRGPGALGLRGGDDEAFDCHGPRVYVDGVPVQDAAFAYAMTSLGDIRRLQAIPPAEVGARFGAAPYGVLLVETRFMATRSMPVDVGVGGERARLAPSRGPATFDWSQDPAGHSFGRAFLGALAGNALGLAAGVSVGRRCVFIEEGTDEIEFTCGHAGVAGAGLAAVALPALGSALGARWGGRTEASVGRFVPAMVGGAMAALPGYIFALSTVGDGVQTMNTVGRVFLIAGSPLLSSFADRIFRTLR